MSKHQYLQQVVQRIANTFHPISIILFGSYAYGTPSIHSDLDILIVTRTKNTSEERHQQVQELFRERTVPMDFVIRTPKEIRQRIQRGDFFLEEIIHKGKILYGRRPF